MEMRFGQRETADKVCIVFCVHEFSLLAVLWL